eukprot:811800-Rhodomonas_salina.2
MLLRAATRCPVRSDRRDAVARRVEFQGLGGREEGGDEEPEEGVYIGRDQSGRVARMKAGLC